ncbi:MAG: hypothetical protein M9949_10735 [Candidatus Kapabacteria bacterium]|nr:hypothetical protein [Candidatus Kapabacteria bacterium]
MQDLQTQHHEEMQLIEKRKQAELELNKAIIGSSSGALDRISDVRHKNQIEKLEEMKEAEIITEVEYNKRKEDLEREHQNNKKAIQDAARGAEIEAQRQHDLALLNEQRAREQAILNAIDPTDTKPLKPKERN